MSKKAQFSNKKLPGCFNRLPCGSGRKYKQCCGK
ncbi:MAG: SEC-C domain-containing protein [Bacilli bacterium]|nr:SEC-C domain-containing protein [Bacilli bacterium]